MSLETRKDESVGVPMTKMLTYDELFNEDETCKSCKGTGKVIHKFFIARDETNTLRMYEDDHEVDCFICGGKGSRKQADYEKGY